MEEYRSWLFDMIAWPEAAGPDNYTERFERLLLYLSGVPFRWSAAHDENRAADGLALREHFAALYANGYLENTGENDAEALPFWAGRLNDECSVLEMMIALAVSCDGVTYDRERGPNAGYYFWVMIRNLGLDGMDNRHFDKTRCKRIVERFLDRAYRRDGHGGLFVTRNPDIDMRKSEIWYQANTWMIENTEEDEDGL